jgi:putative hydrolase of the HAD superfamily
MKDTVLFDLGATLVRYYERAEFPAILQEAVSGVRDFLQRQGVAAIDAEVMWQGVRQEDHESDDFRVRPLEERLGRIFGLDAQTRSTGLDAAMCRHFMRPIFALARRYDDVVPTLERLREKGFRTAIVSNTPWGSPANLWREELARLGLADLVDAAVFCRDTGWRKPAPPLFDQVLDLLRASPAQCVFVGDDPRWDVAGAEAAGIEPILIDRRGTAEQTNRGAIRNLAELWDRLGISAEVRRAAPDRGPEALDIYRDFAEFYDIYVGDRLDDLSFYLDYAEPIDGPVLEIGAGSGRLTIPIARAGVPVVAVDVSESMLARLRSHLQKETEPVRERIRIVAADMCDLDLGEAFDLIIVPFYAFNYLLTPEAQNRALERLEAHLSPAGRLLIDVFVPLRRVANCPPEPVLKVDRMDLRTGKEVRGWNVYSMDTERQIESRRHQFEVMRRDGTVVRKEFTTRRRYSFRTELDALFATRGLSVDDVFGGYERQPVRPDSEQLVYVLRRGQAQ